MATDLSSNYINKLIPGLLKGWQNNMVFTKTVDRAVVTDSDFTNPVSGDRCYVKRPQDFFAVETSDGDLTSENWNSMQRGRASAIAQNVITIPVEWNFVEQAQEMNDTDIAEAMQKMSSRAAIKLETNLATFAKNNLAHTLGTVGTQITEWKHVAQVSSFASAFGIPEYETNTLLSPWACEELADAQNSIFQEDLVGDSWARARIKKNFGGTKAFLCNTLASHTTGAGYGDDTVVVDGVAPTQTFAGAKDSYQTTIAITGLDSGDTITAGDRIEIPDVYWVNQSTREISVGRDGQPLPYQGVVVTGGTADGNGDVSIVVSGPAIYEAAGQHNTISAAIGTSNGVTIKGTNATSYTHSIWHHPQAMGLAFVKLPKLHATESKVITSKDGSFSMRLSMDSNIITGKQYMRIDLQPVFSCFNPLLGGVVWGY